MRRGIERGDIYLISREKRYKKDGIV